MMLYTRDTVQGGRNQVVVVHTERSRAGLDSGSTRVFYLIDREIFSNVTMASTTIETRGETTGPTTLW